MRVCCYCEAWSDGRMIPIVDDMRWKRGDFCQSNHAFGRAHKLKELVCIEWPTFGGLNVPGALIDLNITSPKCSGKVDARSNDLIGWLNNIPYSGGSISTLCDSIRRP